MSNYKVLFTGGLYINNNIIPLVHIDNVQGNVRIVASLSTVASEIPSAHRTAGMIIKTSSNNKYYMYKNSNINNFSTQSNWQELGSGSGGSGTTGATGASAYEVWLSAGNSGTEQDFIEFLTGTEWTNGTGSPNPANGAIGDFYLDTNNGEIFKKTSASAWTSLMSIKGATGATGPQGPPGLNGRPGAAGTSIQTITYSDTTGRLTITLDDGSTPIVTSPLTGSDGAAGNDGADGLSLSIKGTKTVSEILALGSPSTGDLYIASNSGTVNGVATVAGDGVVWTGAQWSNVGGIRGPQGETGAAGANGTDGTNGSQWTAASGVPDNSNGDAGDFYYDTATDKIYKKGASAWAEITDLTVLGWEGASYDNSTGQVTFTHADPQYTFTTDDIRGSDGSAGAAATINVNTVVSLPEGSTPTVTNVGTTSAALLNFGIPAGSTGPQGRGISTVDYNSSTGLLQFTMDDGSVEDIGFINGADGTNGADISSAARSGDDIIFTLNDTDSTQVVLSDIIPALKGDTGNAGPGVETAEFSGDDIVFTLSNNAGTFTLTGAKTSLKGDKGEAGSGVSIIATTGSDYIATLDTTTLQSGSMFILDASGDAGNGISGSAGEGVVWSDEAWSNVGAIRGPSGSQGPTGPQGGQGSPGPPGAQGATGAYVSQSSFSGDDIVFTLSNDDTVTLEDAATKLTGSTLHATGPFTASIISASTNITASDLLIINDLAVGDDLFLNSTGKIFFDGVDGSEYITSPTTDILEINANNKVINDSDLQVTGNITASGNISSSGVIEADTLTANNLVFNQGATSIKIEAPDEAFYTVEGYGREGADITIEAGSAYGLGHTGGNLILRPGFGAGTADSGDITLHTVGSGGTGGSGSIFLTAPITQISDNLNVLGQITASGVISASNIVLDGIPNLSASLAAAEAGGDDLGNHTAVQALNMNGEDIVNVNNITFSPGATSIKIETPDRSSNADGADLTIESGHGFGPSGDGGDIKINAGPGSGSGYGGDIIISPGAHDFSSQFSGSVKLLSDKVTIESATFGEPDLILKGNVNSHIGSPSLFFQRERADGTGLTDNTVIGQVFFNGTDALSNDQTYARIINIADDTSNGSERSTLDFDVNTLGNFTLRTGLSLHGGGIDDEKTSYRIDVKLGNPGTNSTSRTIVQGRLEVDESITGSADISASGLLFASASHAPTHYDDLRSVIYDKASGRFYYTGSYGVGSQAGGGTGDGIFTTVGNEKLTTNHLNISGTLDIHTSSNALVQVLNNELVNGKVFSLSGTSFYEGATNTQLGLTYGTALSKDWFTFTGGIPRLGINASNPEAMIHLSQSHGSQPEVRFDSASVALKIGLDKVGGSYISSSKLTLNSDVQIAPGASFTFNNSGDAELTTGTAILKINPSGQGIGVVQMQSSLHVDNDVILKEQVIARGYSLSGAPEFIDNTLYEENGLLKWNGKPVLTSPWDYKLPTQGLTSNNDFSITTIQPSSKVIFTTPSIELNSAITSSNESINFDVPFAVPKYNSEDEVKQIPTASLRGGELVYVQGEAGPVDVLTGISKFGPGGTNTNIEHSLHFPEAGYSGYGTYNATNLNNTIVNPEGNRILLSGVYDWDAGKRFSVYSLSNTGQLRIGRVIKYDAELLYISNISSPGWATFTGTTRPLIVLTVIRGYDGSPVQAHSGGIATSFSDNRPSGTVNNMAIRTVQQQVLTAGQMWMWQPFTDTWRNIPTGSQYLEPDNS